ncbi:hypothetical protein LguiA_030865 [Lonicera macranthoides]
MIIVYEYMVNGTLADHLHKKVTNGSSSTSTLSWVQRLKICIGAARGLDYLHTGTGVVERVIHRDVKSSNILLDENWAARISDFGMSKIGPVNTTFTHVSTNVKGTFGYLDPEYFLTSKLTRKSDVYSFGVVLFEVLCGRPVIDSRLDHEQRGLAGWAHQNMKEGTLNQIIDPRLTGQILPDSLKTFAQIADQCLHMFSKNRPTMAEVVVSLELALALQERVDSFVFEDFFTENQENSISALENEGTANLQNNLQLQDQMDEITQRGDARNEHPREKPIKKTALTRIVRQALLGTARVISGNKLPKVKRTSRHSGANNKDEMVTVGNKQFDANVGSSLNKEETTSTWSREEKVNRIFQLFDANRDGGLGRREMAALVAATNPRVKFSDDQIEAILEEVYRTYDEFVDGEKGLTFSGLLQTYNDGIGDPDRDFDTLGLEL